MGNAHASTKIHPELQRIQELLNSKTEEYLPQSGGSLSINDRVVELESKMHGKIINSRKNLITMIGDDKKIYTKTSAHYQPEYLYILNRDVSEVTKSELEDSERFNIGDRVVELESKVHGIINQINDKYYKPTLEMFGDNGKIYVRPIISFEIEDIYDKIEGIIESNNKH